MVVDDVWYDIILNLMLYFEFGILNSYLKSIFMGYVLREFFGCILRVIFKFILFISIFAIFNLRKVLVNFLT